MVATTSEQAEPAHPLAVLLGMFLFATVGVAIIAAIIEPRRRRVLGLSSAPGREVSFGAALPAMSENWLKEPARALRAEAKLVKDRLRGRISTATYQSRMAELARFTRRR